MCSGRSDVCGMRGAKGTMCGGVDVHGGKDFVEGEVCVGEMCY